MGKSCCAVGCANRYSKLAGIPFYRFPTDVERKRLWIAAVNRKNWAPSEHSWICGAHFISGCKSNDPTSPDYTPSVFSHVKSPQKRKLLTDMGRYERTIYSKKRRLADGNRLQALLDDGNGSQFCESQSGTASCTTMTMHDIEKLEEAYHTMQNENSQLHNECEELKKANHQLMEENCTLKREHNELLEKYKALENSNKKVEQKLDTLTFSQASLRDDDMKVKYYTGLAKFAVLMAIFNFLSPSMESGNRSVLSLFQQFMIVLMKFRLNLGDQDLAFRFGVHQSTISRCISKWIDVMYVRLKPLVKWPEREQLVKTMPMDFRRHYKHCVTIIDCFEVFVERPTNLKARAQTWSNYKHHNTIKFLIGIAPQGSITFISKGWGGRASDVHITENCGLLELLQPGDVILADRGFNIHDSASMYCARVQLPLFTRGKNQLSKEEVDVSRQLSRVRIHVERVIGVVRQKYTILQSTLPVNFIMCSKNQDISVIDKVVTICCALCNCCKSVVSFE